MAKFLLRLLLLLWVAMQQCLAVWRNMGEGECHGETCWPGQYCSDDTVFEGCRDCANLTPWCPDVDKLKNDFPQCAYICDLKAARDRIEALEAEVVTLENRTQSPQQTIFQQNVSAAKTEEQTEKARAQLQKITEALTKSEGINEHLRNKLERESKKVFELGQTNKLLEETRRSLEKAQEQSFYLIVAIVCGGFILGLAILIVSACLCQSRSTIRTLHEQITTGNLSSTASSASGKNYCCFWPCLRWTQKYFPSFRYVAQPHTDQSSSQPMLPVKKANARPAASSMPPVQPVGVQADGESTYHSQSQSPDHSQSVTYALSASKENFVPGSPSGNTTWAAKNAGSLVTTDASIEMNGRSTSRNDSGNISDGNDTGNVHSKAHNVCSAMSLASTVASTETNGSSDSGNGTGSSNNGGDGCQRKIVAPTGDRTEHEHGDRQDFMQVVQT